MKIQHISKYKLLFFITSLSVCFALFALLPAYAQDSSSSNTSTSWETESIANDVLAPASSDFEVEFTYTITTTDGKSATQTITISSNDEPSGSLMGFSTWSKSAQYNKFEMPAFSKEGRYNAVVTKSWRQTRGDGYVSAGAVNRWDNSAKNIYETYNVTLYVMKASDSTFKISDIVVWNGADDPLLHDKPEDYKTTACYQGYIKSPGGSVTLSFEEPKNGYAKDIDSAYIVRFFDLSRMTESGERSFTGKMKHGSEEPVDVTFTFLEDQSWATTDRTFSPGTTLTFDSGVMFIGTTYDIESNIYKDDCRYTASASSSLPNDSGGERLFSNIKWQLGRPFSLKYGEELPAQQGQEKGEKQYVTVIGPASANAVNACSVLFDSDTITPTGFIIDNSPYIALIIIPAVLIFAWYIYRRKHN